MLPNIYVFFQMTCYTILDHVIAIFDESKRINKKDLGRVLSISQGAPLEKGC